LDHQFDQITEKVYKNQLYFGTKSEIRGFYYVMMTTLVHTIVRWTVGKVTLGSINQSNKPIH